MYLCPQALAAEFNIDDGWMTHEHMASSTWPEEPLGGGRSQPGFYRSILCPEKTPDVFKHHNLNRFSSLL